MKITKARLKQIINEELTRQDKSDVKKMVKDELEKLLKKKEMKDQISELTKKILKKLYKDLSLEHPYIIDRIKVQCYTVGVNRDDADPFSTRVPAAKVGDWVYFSKTKITGLVIELDDKTNGMRVHCFGSMRVRWFVNPNYGHYQIL